MNVLKIDRNGYTAQQQNGKWNFVPRLFYGSVTIGGNANEPDGSTKGKVAQKPPRQALLIFICMPVSPGNSRLIFASPRNFAVWMDRIVPRWVYHINQNLIIDSDCIFFTLRRRK